MTTTKDQERELLLGGFEDREAGVADLMELYERIEDVYVRASASAPESEVVYTSDSTNIVERADAHLG